MGYLHASDIDPLLGRAGCPGGCPCHACAARGLGERYVPDDADDDDDADDANSPVSEPRPRASGSQDWLGQPPTAPRSAERPIQVITGFAFDRTSVPAPEHAKLIRLARLILGGARGPYRLVGHTDPVGTGAYNLDLGLRRAREVERQMAATLERMRPTSSRAVAFVAASAGETQPLAANATEAGRARNRRVEIFGPAAAPEPPRCQYRISDAPAIEREAARRTLAVSAQVARRFARTVGALNARGRFTPTIIDNKYWFAKLYEFITYEEIAAMPNFRHPAFVMHFITPFYGLYLQALDTFQSGSPLAVSPLWMRHFTASARPDNSSSAAWMDGVRTSLVTGVAAHIQGDMATALVRTYRSYVAKYCLTSPPPLDTFSPDFFDRNRMVFERAQASFLLHASQLGPFPVGPEFGQYLFAVGARATGSLDLDEVFRWRKQAWADAKGRLGQ